MERNCGRCGNEFVELKLSEEQALEIWGLQRQNLNLFIVKKLKNEIGYSHRASKIIMEHLNSEKGKCKWCDYDQLQGENIDCPNCKAFNYNMDFEPKFNQAFCSKLEYNIDFTTLERDDLKGFWCDGIDQLPMDIRSLAKSRIEKDSVIKTKAWIGKDGQDEYEMVITLGDEFVKAYKSNATLLNAIPDKKEKDWIAIDIERKLIEIKLR